MNAEQTLPILVDTNAAAAAVQRPAVTIRGWAHRGLITAHGKDRARRALYDLADIYRAAGNHLEGRP